MAQPQGIAGAGPGVRALLARAGAGLDEGEAAALERLLLLPDNDLLDLVMGRAAAADVAEAGLVEKLRAA